MFGLLLFALSFSESVAFRARRALPFGASLAMRAMSDVEAQGGGIGDATQSHGKRAGVVPSARRREIRLGTHGWPAPG
jgi:hypothetical protein